MAYRNIYPVYGNGLGGIGGGAVLPTLQDPWRWPSGVRLN